jgi:hypothetical protein
VSGLADPRHNYRCRSPSPETDEQFQARVQQSRAEQLAAEERRAAQQAARKLAQEQQRAIGK